METLVISATALIVGFALGWYACAKLAPKVGAIETRVQAAEKDLTK
jgi:hypothetical protein